MMSDNLPIDSLETGVGTKVQIPKWDSKEVDFLSMGSPLNVVLNVADLSKEDGDSANAEQKFQEFFHQFSLARGSGWGGPDELRIVDVGLRMKSVNITIGMGKALAFAIAHCPRLKGISLAFLTSVSPGALELLFEDALPTLPLLSFLDLDKMQLSAEVLASLQTTCSRCKKLSTLAIGDPLSLQDSRQIELLRREAICSLSEALSNVSKLENLDLHCVIDGTNAEAVFLADRIRKLPHLAVLCLGQNSLSGDGAEIVANSLGHLASLEWLNMGRKFCELRLFDDARNALTMNHLIRDAGRELVKSLGQCSKLLRIDISEDIVTYREGRLLGEALAACPQLEILSIHSCFVHKGGALGLASFFPKMARLKRLRVEIEHDYQHPMGAFAGKRLVGLNELALHVHLLPALEELTLEAQLGKRVRCGPLEALLRGCASLRELAVTARPLSEGQGARISEALRGGARSLRKLRLFMPAKRREGDAELEEGWERGVQLVKSTCAEAGVCAEGVQLSVELAEEEEEEEMVEEEYADEDGSCGEEEEEAGGEEPDRDEAEAEARHLRGQTRRRGLCVWEEEAEEEEEEAAEEEAEDEAEDEEAEDEEAEDEEAEEEEAEEEEAEEEEAEEEDGDEAASARKRKRTRGV